MATRKNSNNPASAALNAPQHIPAGKTVRLNALMPGLRVRQDGWTQERTQRVFDTLGHTGCMTDAARVAGLSVTGAR